ncbi:MAG: hypothetical protein ABSF38_08320 [Verrucomicrobiota bacterium]|jgi:hypothetical protein
MAFSKKSAGAATLAIPPSFRRWAACLSAFLAFSPLGRAEPVAGPLYSDFRLTLDSGDRQEVLGPLFYSEQSDSQRQWALAPLLGHARTPDLDWTETDFMYPLFTWRRFGSEYRAQFFQLLSTAGGKTQPGADFRLFTIFPLYFQARSTNASLNYTALAPFYGHLYNRLFRDETKFVMFPLYSQTRKKDVVTDNYLYPFFHLRHGNQLHGWQFWPVVGTEHKSPTLLTNNYNEVQTVGGYDRWFAAWPFVLRDLSGLGTSNRADRVMIMPFYSRLRSPLRDESSYGWPFGYWRINDREKKYREQSLLWPFFVAARGAKTETRVFPFYSHAAGGGLVSDFYLWPLYKNNRLKADSLERERVRIFFFLYSDLREKIGPSGASLHRVDFWPFFTWRRDMDQRQRLQVLALLEPFFPDNRSISRDYSQLWSFWRAEKNVQTGAASQSLLWNLYRRETGPASKKYSLLFGLFQYQSNAQVASWRVCYIPIGKKTARTAAPGA